MARGRQIIKEIQLEELSLAMAAEEFYTHNKGKGLAAATQKTYKDYVNAFINWCGIDTPACDITTKKLDAYMCFKTDSGTKSVSVATQMRHIRTFINFCIERKYMDDIKVTIPKFEKELKEPYSDEEMKKLLQKPKTKNWVEFRSWAMVNYFFATGQRLSTVLNIKVYDLDLNNARVKLEWNKDKEKKWMPLSSAIVKVLEEYIDISRLHEQDYLFPEYEGGQLKVRGCQDSIADYNKSRGVTKTSIHLFRHTFAKNYIMAGGSPVKLQKLLNHKTIDMTMNYVHLYGDDIAKDLDLFNPLDNFKRSSYTPMARRKIG